MAYKLLGMATWKAATWFLRHKLGTGTAPKGLLAGGVVVVLLGVVLLLRGRGGASSEA